MAADYSVPNAAMTQQVGVALACVLVAVLLVACVQGRDMILEFKDVQFFQGEQTASSPAAIKLSGLAFHSSLAVREITTSQYDESLQVLVHLTPAAAGLSGNFDYILHIPASVNTVSFGREKAVIWTRSGGVVQHR